MITSKNLIEKTGISRATLNNYIGMGLVIKPVVKRVSPSPGTPLKTIGYFPDWTLDKIKEIQALKHQGLSMSAICDRLNSNNTQTLPSQYLNQSERLDVKNEQLFENELPVNETSSKGDSQVFNKPLNLTVDNIVYPAYMINYDCGLIWINDAAQKLFFATSKIPDHADERSIIPSLLDWVSSSSKDQKKTLFINLFNTVKHRFNRDTLYKKIVHLNQHDKKCLEDCYDQASAENSLIQDTFMFQANIGIQRVVAMSFREGVFFTYIPEVDDANQILNLLSRRDSVINTLLSQQLPVLTPIAAIVADLQNSVRICSELPPDEYFKLINEIWLTLDPLFKKYYGTYGKHTGDGMVYYFFPQPDNNYLMNAILCACEIKDAMKKMTNLWITKKGWSNQLYMNIGLNEGQEWLGTFKTNTSYEFAVLGETMNVCSRLSDFARLGKIWATKNLVSKLSHSEQEMIDYGITRLGVKQEQFVPNTYAKISTLVDKDKSSHKKVMDISGSVVTEIRSMK